MTAIVMVVMFLYHHYLPRLRHGLHRDWTLPIPRPDGSTRCATESATDNRTIASAHSRTYRSTCTAANCAAEDCAAIHAGFRRCCGNNQNTQDQHHRNFHFFTPSDNYHNAPIINT